MQTKLFILNWGKRNQEEPSKALRSVNLTVIERKTHSKPIESSSELTDRPGRRGGGWSRRRRRGRAVVAPRRRRWRRTGRWPRPAEPIRPRRASGNAARSPRSATPRQWHLPEKIPAPLAIESEFRRHERTDRMTTGMFRCALIGRCEINSDWWRHFELIHTRGLFNRTAVPSCPAQHKFANGWQVRLDEEPKQCATIRSRFTLSMSSRAVVRSGRAPRMTFSSIGSYQRRLPNRFIRRL